MMRSMFSGVSGLRVHQTRMDVIANNISNVNTVGFKSSRVTFSDAMNQMIQGASGPQPDFNRGGVNPMQVGLGVNLASIDKLMTQGAAQRTDRPMDVMIQGEGFFIVGDASGTFFTRAGNFNLDPAGNLVTFSGLKVQGWDSDWTREGDPIVRGLVQPIVIPPERQAVGAVATTQVDFRGNLNATEEPYRFGTKEIFDSLGNLWTIEVRYRLDGNVEFSDFEDDDMTPIDASRWVVEFGRHAFLNGDRENPVEISVAPGGGDAPNGVPPGVIGGNDNALITIGGAAGDDDWTEVGSIYFSGGPNPAAGRLISAGNVGGVREHPTHSAMAVNVVAPPTLLLPGSSPAVTMPPITFGNENGVVQMNFGAMTQFSRRASDARSVRMDGNMAGNLMGISVGPDGIITGRYTNGDLRRLGQLAVARFDNPAGLEKAGDNLYVETVNSGPFDGIGQDVMADGSRMMGGVLEMSNVDLANEFTDMIITQRGFQANSRSITTSDEMLIELVNLKR